MVDVSIIVPTKDRPDLLAETLGSIRQQTVDSWECIVVNDGGIVPQLPTDPRFHAIDLGSSRGPAAARNAGVEAATGDTLAFLDDDDEWTRRRLEIGIEGLERAPVAVCWFRYADEADHGRDLNGDVRDVILDDVVPSLGATMLRKSVWQALDASYPACEDQEWWLRMASSTPIATVRETGLIVRRHDSVRESHGLRARLAQSQRLLLERADYFADHPAAAAFRWRRIGILAHQAGDRRLAVRAGAKAFRLRPSAGTARSLLASLKP